jgi:hypothetical protein
MFLLQKRKGGEEEADEGGLGLGWSQPKQVCAFVAYFVVLRTASYFLNEF